MRWWHHQLTHLNIHKDWSRNVFRKNVKFQNVTTLFNISYPIFIMFAPICREIFMLSFEIMVILDWTSPLSWRLIRDHVTWGLIACGRFLGTSHLPLNLPILANHFLTSDGITCCWQEILFCHEKLINATPKRLPGKCTSIEFPHHLCRTRNAKFWKFHYLTWSSVGCYINLFFL